MAGEVVNPRKTRLFADIMIPGTERVAMHRVFAGLRLFPFEHTERNWFMTQVTASYPGRIGEQLVWWRIRHEDGVDTFINVDPGEHRSEPPEGDVLILDLPEMPTQHECRALLQAAIERSEASHVPEGYYRNLVSLCRAFLESPETVVKEGHDRVRAIIPLMREAESGHVVEPLSRLYQECLACPRFDQLSFAPVMLLLQLQRMVSAWLEQDWLVNPSGMLGAFLKLVSQDPEKRDRLNSACEEIAAGEYAEARRTLNEALNAASLSSMGRLLVDAHQLFTMVHVLSQKATESGLDFRQPRPAIVIEESATCTLTGLGYGAEFMTKHPIAIPQHLLDQAAATGVDEFEAARNWGSAPVRPVVNRQFAQVLAAQAMTLSPEQDKVRRGLDFLLQFRRSLSTDPFEDVEFERGWLDQALLAAYRKLGMKSEAQRIAAQIAGRLMMSKLLSRGDQ